MTINKSKQRNADSVHVALLRGVNVGGRNMLPMQDLAAMFRDAGCGDVRTYIQIRLPARDDQHRPQLEHRGEAGRVGQKPSVFWGFRR